MVCLGLIAGAFGGLEARPNPTIREILLSRESIGEARDLNSPITWRFRSDGSFSAVALSGVPSWSARGTSKETPQGYVRLRGVSDHATDRKQRGLVFTRTISGVEIIERKNGLVWVRFVWR
jgi:hypothetical protein